MADKSIVELSVQELEKLDLEEVRDIFINELLSLVTFDEYTRNNRFQYVFEKLFSLQSTNTKSIASDEHLVDSEQRLYADLISTPGLINVPYIREFLENEFETVSYDTFKKRNLLLKIFDYYSSHSNEAIDKFNYIFRSSDSISNELLVGVDLDFYFGEEVMVSFTKEDLSQIFRFYFFKGSDKEILKVLFSKENRNALEMISYLNNQVKLLVGQGNIFLENIFKMLCDDRRESIIKLLNDSYNKLNSDDYKYDKVLAIRELVNYIMYEEYDRLNLGGNFSKVDNLDDLIYNVLLKRQYNHDKVINLVINDDLDLYNFKSFYLYNVYGISLEEASKLIKVYGQYINELELSEVDKKSLSVLKAIKNIVSLDMTNSDINEKINRLRKEYLSYVSEHDINYQNHMATSMILNVMFSKMYADTYNETLLSVKEREYFLEDGVKIIDPGIEFNIVLSSFMGVNNFYKDFLDLKSKWNTASYSTSQGICCSYINNQNLGIINLGLPILGFSKIPEYGLNAMGPYDIFSNVSVYNLRRVNSFNKIFIPGNYLSNESRYGYNELLIDRFLVEDKDNSLKLQPDYVVFYKFDDLYQDSDVYRSSLKVAKDFNIPIVMIDIRKVKENEKRIIDEKRDELFSSDKCDKKLVSDIVVRYMNNYVGSYTFVNTPGCNYDIDFSVEGMGSFFDDYFSKVNSIIDENERNEWIRALEEVYLKEKDKFRISKRVAPYSLSVQSFVLSNYLLEQRIDSYRNKDSTYNKVKTRVAFVDVDGYRIDSKKEEVDFEKDVVKVQLPGGSAGVYLIKGECSPEISSIIRLINGINFGSGIVINSNYKMLGMNGDLLWGRRDLREEVNLMENLVLSYFFENCNDMLVEDVIAFDFNLDVKFNCSENYDFINDVKESCYSSYLNPDSPNYIKVGNNLFNRYMNVIKDMNNKDFLNYLGPIIEKYSNGNNERFEVVAGRLLDKKNNIDKVFSKIFNKEKEDTKVGKK